MAYKFQLGAYTASGSLTQEGAAEVDALTADSLNLQSGGITNAGAIAGATSIDGSGDLTMGTITMTGFSVDADGDVVAKSVVPGSAGTDDLGSASAEWRNLFLSDGGIAYFGNDQEVQLEHDADDGLKLRNVNTGAARPARLILELSSSSPADNDQIANIRGVGFNDNDQNVIYSQILTKATDVSDGSEDGGIMIGVW